MYRYVCAYAYTEICVRIYIHTYMHTFMHTDVHAYIHTYIHTERQTDRQTVCHRRPDIPYRTIPYTSTSTTCICIRICICIYIFVYVDVHALYMPARIPLKTAFSSNRSFSPWPQSGLVRLPRRAEEGANMGPAHHTATDSQNPKRIGDCIIRLFASVHSGPHKIYHVSLTDPQICLSCWCPPLVWQLGS